MNIATIIGVITGLAVLVFSISSATGNASIFWNPHGMAVVIGGVLAATLICYPIKDVLRLFVNFTKVLKREDLPITIYVEEVIYLSKQVLGQGTLHLESELKDMENYFLKDGIRMLVDQYPTEKIRQIMETTIDNQYDREIAEAAIFRTMGKLAPAFGMLGTLIGLIVMFQNLQSDIAAIGPAMAVAMMSTFYGLIFTNLVFNPVAVKMEKRVEERVLLMKVIMEGLILVSKRTPPEIVRDELKAFLPARKWADIDTSKLPDQKLSLNKNGESHA